VFASFDLRPSFRTAPPVGEVDAGWMREGPARFPECLGVTASSRPSVCRDIVAWYPTGPTSPCRCGAGSSPRSPCWRVDRRAA